MKSLADYVQQARKGGHTRSGIILGVRLAMVGLEELVIEEPKDHHRGLVVFVETDRCLPDAIELVTGCRLGNRTLKFKDMGKMAATFVDLRTGRAVRVAARESANESAREMFPLLTKEEALERAYSILPDEDLFTRRIVNLSLAPEDIPGYAAPRVICDECKESISFGRELSEGQRTLCRSCGGDSYLDPR
jgi:formylmethanofuran dehydrogenase subunit E